MSPLVAVTGSTGFLGQALVQALAARGCRLRLLVRRDPVGRIPAGLSPEIVIGSVADPAALARLVRGADRVIHVAGLVRARDRTELFAANQAGTARLAAAVLAEAPTAPVLLVSSLAAREPGLSAYAASKHAGELALQAAGPGRNWTVVRPPALYGPGCADTLPLFRMASRGLLPLLGPAAGRIALQHVADAAAQIAFLAEMPASGEVWTMGGARPQGYAWTEIVETAGFSVGRQVGTVRLPGPLVLAAGTVAGALARLRKRPATFDRGKAHEMLHLDWGVGPSELPPAPWLLPSRTLTEGFSETVGWYRAAGWISGYDRSR